MRVSQLSLGWKRTACCRRCCRRPPQALASNRSGALRAMLMQGLRSTDAARRRRRAGDRRPSCSRCCCGRPTAGHWPCCRQQGVDAAGRAAPRRRPGDLAPGRAHRVAATLLACRCRRSGCCSRASRSASASACSRLLAHPRFRAAFDFLELRLSGDPDVRRGRRVLARGAAAVPPATRCRRANASRRRPHAEAEAGEQAPRKRRRRRGDGSGASAAAVARMRVSPACRGLRRPGRQPRRRRRHDARGARGARRPAADQHAARLAPVPHRRRGA